MFDVFVILLNFRGIERIIYYIKMYEMVMIIKVCLCNIYKIKNKSYINIRGKNWEIVYC